MSSLEKASMRDALGVGGVAVTIEHVAATAWASSVTPASYVTRAGFVGGAVTVTPSGVASPSATVTIGYSTDYSTEISSATLGTVTGNVATTFALPNFAAMPGLCYRVKLTSATGTGGTVGITISMS
jgi:hypothetical protein